MDMSRIIGTKYKFICYLCEKECNIRDKGAQLGSATIDSLSNEICTKCVHKNYCWATDKDLQHITNEVYDKEIRPKGLISWRNI
jgi:hypothetical protein